MIKNFYRNSLLFTLLSILLTALLSSCGGDEKPTVIHSCQLFSESEIKKLMDSAITWPPRETHQENAETGHWMSMCNYYSEQTGLSASLMIQPFDPQSQSAEEALDSYRNSIRDNLPEYEMKELEATNSVALWNEQSGQLTLFANRHMFLIGVLKKDMIAGEKFSFCQKFSEMTLAKDIFKNRR